MSLSLLCSSVDVIIVKFFHFLSQMQKVIQIRTERRTCQFIPETFIVDYVFFLKLCQVGFHFICQMIANTDKNLFIFFIIY